MRFGKPRKNTRRNNPRYFTITENIKMENNSNKNMNDVQFYLEEFYPFAKKALGFEQDATVVFESDLKNSKNPLGKTAHYDPSNSRVTVYVDNRHPKDVMRSISHELVHHAQNLRGDLTGGAMEEGYAQSDDHLRKMEEEAYRKGNMVFRDWTDTRNNPENQENIMSRLMQEWGYDDQAIAESSEKFEEGQLVVVVASALAVDGEKTGSVVKSDDKSVTIKLDDDQEGKYVPEDKMVKVKVDYVEPRVEAGHADVMGETEGVNEMYDDDYDDFDMGALEDEFPWLAKSVKTKEVPAELAAELAAEFGDKEEPEEEEEDVIVMKEKGFHGSDEEKEMTDKMSNKEFYDYHTRDKHISPDLKGDMGPIPGMEGPFQFKSGAVLYWDNSTGEYYDRGKDMYLDREEAAELTMEEGMGGKVDHKKAAWMKAYDDAAGNPQPKPRDFWDTATFLYNQGDDPVEAGQHYAARAGKGVEPEDDDQGVYSMHYTENVNEAHQPWRGKRTMADLDKDAKTRETDFLKKGSEPQQGDDVSVVSGGLAGAYGEVMELTTTTEGEPGVVIYLHKDANKRVMGAKGDEVVAKISDVEVDKGIQAEVKDVTPQGRMSVGGSIGESIEGDGDGWGEIHGDGSEEAPTMDAAVNALSKLDKTIESYLQNPQYEADARDLQEIRGMFWQEIKNGTTPGNFSQELKDAVAYLDTIVRDEIPQDLYYSLHPEILENKKMDLEEIVRQAVRKAIKEGKYRREDDSSDSEEEGEEVNEFLSGKINKAADKINKRTTDSAETLDALAKDAEEEEEEPVEESKSTEKHDDDPALKGDQDELPDNLQKAIIDDEEEKVDETSNKDWYDSNLFESLMKKWAK